MSNKTNIGALGTLAILMIFPIQMGMTCVTPAMAVLAEHWGMTVADAAYLSTLSTITTTVTTILLGAVAGKKLKFRTCAILGSAIYLIGGVGPAFFDNYVLTLVFRAIMGIGIGFMMPIGNALIIGHFDGDKQSKILGYGTLFMNLGGLIFQTLGGTLVEMEWNYVFYAHLFGITSLIMAFFIKEPEILAAPEPAGKVKTPISKVVIAAAAVLFMFNIFVYPAMMNVSTIFLDKGIGGADLAAMSLNIYTIFGCVGGFVFGSIFTRAQRFVLPMGFLLAAAGCYGVSVTDQFMVMNVCLAMIGFGFANILPAINAWVGISVEPKFVAGSIGIVMALMNLGAFCSTYYLQILQIVANDAVYLPITIGAVVFVAVAVMFIVYNPFKKTKEAAC
ncbi:MAG: MFS transporter [archaeon]|nr:MFS transporter [archaeon]